MWFALQALIGLCCPVGAEATGGDTPSRSCPALAAAPLVYSFVPSPFGASAWAEREFERIRIGAHEEAREVMDARTNFILLALHTRSADDYAPEVMEAPREPEAPAAAKTGYWSVQAIAGPRPESALEAMGLTPEDLMTASDVPPAALEIADAIIGFLGWGLGRGIDLGEEAHGSAMRMDPKDRYVRQKVATKEEESAKVVIRKIVRSIYKILLGVAIGILIWGFVRNTA